MVLLYRLCQFGVAEGETNRLYHRSLRSTEKSLPEGKRIMPEMRFIVFPAFSIDQRVMISRYALEIDD